MIRDKPYRVSIAILPCANCQIQGKTQAAHRNEGKGMGIKTDDDDMMALCVECHMMLDQGGAMGKNERREFEMRMVARTKNLQRLFS